jgi:uncharacterized protein YndB with AHSA1/START domain
MAAATSTAAPTLEVRRTFKASPQRVFDAWTRPEEMKRWAAPGPVTVSHAESDLRVGGTYRIHMIQPGGVEIRAHGVYREVAPPTRLVYTWSWETQPDVTDTIVTVEFTEKGGSTEVVLRHAGLPTDASRERHSTGWNGCLDKLGEVVR